MVARDFWKGRRVLVTGGAGFVGYMLASKLVSCGARVTVLDIKKELPRFEVTSQNIRSKIRYVRGSVVSKATMARVLHENRIQTVFHLAAEAIVGKVHANTEIALDTNIRGTWVVLESTRNAPYVQEIVVASSDKAYGEQSKLPYREDAALKGMNAYDCSKSCTDLIAQMYGVSYSLPVAVVRCGNIYGPGDTNWSRLVPDAFKSAMQGTALIIRSDGTFKRDYVFVDDAVEAYMTLASKLVRDRLHGEAFNFGNDTPLRVTDMLKELKRILPSLRYEITDTARNEIKDQYLDSSKARSVLGWRPAHNIRDGLILAGAWYGEFLKAKGRS